MARVSVLVCVLLVFFGAPRGVAADTIAITSGLVSTYWDGSRAGWELFGEGIHLIGESFGRSPEFDAGTLVDLGRTVEIDQTLCCPVPQTVGGTTFDPLFLKGSFSFSTTPFWAPTAPQDTVRFFEAPFTMLGYVHGFTEPDFSGAPQFAVDLAGSGTATLGPMRAIAMADSNVWINTSGGLTFTFGADGPPPSPTPEPGTLALMASGLAVAAARRLGRRGSR